MLGIEEQIRNSSCYGVAFDGTLSECKRCDVAQRCSARCKALAEEEMTVDVPMEKISNPPTVVQSETTKTPTDKPKTSKAPKPTTKATKPKIEKSKKEYDPNMPELKGMTMEALKALAIERECTGLDVIEGIASPQIKRMRYIMGIKATYEIN